VIAHLEVTNKTDLISLIEAHGKELGEEGVVQRAAKEIINSII